MATPKKVARGKVVHGTGRVIGSHKGPGAKRAAKHALHDAPPPAGLVRFRAIYHDDLEVVAELNGQIGVAGYGTHDVIDRPGRVGLTTYHGRPPLRLTFPLLFDRWPEDGTVEEEIRTLERLHGLDPRLARPPQVVIDGIGVPHSRGRDPDGRWVLTGDPDWDDDIRYRADGNRCYVPVTVTAQRLVRPSTLVEPDEPTHRPKFFKVPHGERLRTLRQIAKHRHAEWRKLRKLNPKLPGDPDHKLKPGTKVRVA